MAAVSEMIVREYFELLGFLIRQEKKYVARGKKETDGIDFVIWNPQPRDWPRTVPFILSSADLGAVARGIIAVRGWHTESFGPGLLESSPEMFRFVEPTVFKQAARAFSPGATPLKIMVVPALAQTAAVRAESIQFLRAKGVDAVIPFHTILADLIARTEPNRNYDKSDLLQIIRILKNYEFFREPQMELFRSVKPGRRSTSH
jgi:hypothetical protein